MINVASCDLTKQRQSANSQNSSITIIPRRFCRSSHNKNMGLLRRFAPRNNSLKDKLSLFNQALRNLKFRVVHKMADSNFDFCLNGISTYREIPTAIGAISYMRSRTKAYNLGSPDQSDCQQAEKPSFFL